MNRVAIILLGLSCLASPAFARKGPKPPRLPSSEERKSQAFTFEAQPFTLFLGTVGAGFTSGASVGHYVDADTVVRATARSGKSCIYERCAYVETTASATLQRFLGNSFFLEGGLMVQNNVYHKVYEEYGAHTYDNHFTYSAETYGGTVALGNQWQFASFTLGVRWLQIAQGVFSRKSRIVADGDEDVGQAQKDRLADLEHETKFYLPSLTLGVSF